jgi:hypothetical protein
MVLHKILAKREEKTAMPDARTMLKALEESSREFEPCLGAQWPEFSRRAGDLVDRFKIIASEDNPEAATRALESTINKLLKVCWDYPYVAELLEQAEETPIQAEPGGGVNRRPPTPITLDIVEVKEIANRYYSLLARLKEAADQMKEHPDDRRAHI